LNLQNSEIDLAMVKHYTLLDHTADLKLRITGSNEAELFKNAGLAVFDLIVDPQTVVPERSLSLRISGSDRADLLVNFLRELLYLWTGREQLIARIDIVEVSETIVNAHVTTGNFEPGRQDIAHEIKAVTYHQIEVSRVSGGGWQATVVLDI
jgi:SHS2 domain-containing protein